MKEKFISIVRRIFSTCFYVGYIPGPAGTYGSFLTVALLYHFIDITQFWFINQNAHLFLLGFTIFVFAGFWLCADTLNNFGKDDPKVVIVDEVAGQIITFLFTPLSAPVLLTGFILFRFFDIVKPYPVHLFEQLDDGVGIMTDDVAAGILSCISLNLLLVGYGFIAARI
ncbi:MAG: phosphatidylglycerophosphatase A [Chitinispirillales bacterium]|jgi:phosphatidylglycerophosphatase A|nr:phosphatidylglycerophosphatase A [Chitinispirillales bacterium]